MKTFNQEENPSEGFEHQRVRARVWYEKGEQSNLKDEDTGVLGSVEERSRTEPE